MTMTLFCWGVAYGINIPESSLQELNNEEDGCDVTSQRCRQELDLTQNGEPERHHGEESGKLTGEFLPGQWTPSYKVSLNPGGRSQRDNEQDNMNEGMLRGSGDPAYPGGAGNTPTSLGTVDSFRP
jgi:hypothetical protein